MNPQSYRTIIRKGFDRLVLALVVAGVSLLLAWTVLGKWAWPALGPDYTDHYNLLVHGFLKGSMAIDVPVPEALKLAANPWDPLGRPADLILPPDTSYFNGRFYLYFGVVPAVAVMWPFRVLMGMDLPAPYTLIFFCVGAFWILTWLWLRLLRDYFAGASLVMRAGGVLVLGLAGGLLMLARRAHFWELPIASGQFWLAAMMAAIYLALRAKRLGTWLALAGFFLGLAVGSRPTLAVAGGALACLVIALGWRHRAEAGWWNAVRRALAAALVAGGPLAATMCGLMAYNYARFGKLTEFGLNYQITSRYEAKMVHFSTTFIPFNWEMYFWRMPQWDRYFPFVRQAITPPEPVNYYTCEYVFGALNLSPVLWGALLLPLWLLSSWRKQLAATGVGLTAFAAALTAVAAATTVVLLCFNTAVARYTADFLPWWLLLGLLGMATVEWCVRRWWALRGIFCVFAAALMLGTAVMAFFASSRLHDVLRYRNPEAYLALARVFNTPTAWWETWRGEPRGPLEMDVVFPDDRVRIREPLVIVGNRTGEIQGLYVTFPRKGFMQLGFESPDRPQPWLSAELPFEPGRAYPMSVELGALYPPDGLPILANWSVREVAWQTRWLRVELDGRLIFDDFQSSVEVSPTEVRVGYDLRQGREPKFTGTITNVRRMGLPRPLTDTAGGGDVELRVSFPKVGLVADASSVGLMAERGLMQPLITAGRRGLSELVAVRMNPDAKTFTLGYENWGSGVLESAPLSLPENRGGTLRVRLGSILDLPANSPLEIMRDTVVVWLDGRPIWWQRSPKSIGPNPPLAVASNPIGSNGATPFFQGRVRSWDRLAPLPAWRSGPFEAVTIQAVDRGTGTEPLLATGVAGAANTLAIEWLPGAKARLIYDHWSYASSKSPEFEWLPGVAHTFDVEWPAFARLDAAKTSPIQRGQLRVQLDGRAIWDAEMPFYVADSGTVVVGKNVAGSSVASPALTSVVLEVKQRPLASGSSLPASLPVSP